MFLGQYRHNLDSKDRLTVPARFRELLQNGAYVMQGFDRNLMILTEDAFQAISQRIKHTSVTDPDSRLLRRLIYSTADRVDLDKGGRILIPLFLRQWANLSGEVILVGMGDFFEIWSPETWAVQHSLLEDADANAQRFSTYEISTEL